MILRYSTNLIFLGWSKFGFDILLYFLIIFVEFWSYFSQMRVLFCEVAASCNSCYNSEHRTDSREFVITNIM